MLGAIVALLAGCAPSTRAGTDAWASPEQVAARPVVASATAVSGGGDPGRPPRPSPACLAHVAVPIPDHVTVDGRQRTLLHHAPATTALAARDLVIAFHGRTNDAAQARRYFGLDDALPEAVVVFPRALPATPTSFAWRDPGDPPHGQRDFAFVDAIVDAVGRARCIDLDRVFVVGHSLGGYFANDVACHLGDRIRAVASVAGGILGDGCASGTAALQIHHADDPLVPFAAGEAARDAFLAANGLADATPVPTAHPDLASLRCVGYGLGAAHPVVWCAHDDPRSPSGRRDAHAWPPGTAAAIATFLRGLP